MPAAGPPSRTPLVVAIAVVAIGGLVVLNMLQERNDPKYQERMEREAAQRQQKEAAKKAADQPPPSEAAGGQDLVMFGPEKDFGAPKADRVVTIGWTWTPTVQQDPTKVYAAVEALQQAVSKTARIRVVNLDARPGAVPAGIAVDGKVVVPAMPDGAIPPQAVSAVTGMLGGAVPPSAAPPSAAPPGPAEAAPTAPKAAPGA